MPLVGMVENIHSGGRVGGWGAGASSGCCHPLHPVLHVNVCVLLRRIIGFCTEGDSYML